MIKSNNESSPLDNKVNGNTLNV